MKPIFYVNPLTHSVDLAGFYLSRVSSVVPSVDWLVLVALSSLFLVISVRIFEGSTIDRGVL